MPKRSKERAQLSESRRRKCPTVRSVGVDLLRRSPGSFAGDRTSLSPDDVHELASSNTGVPVDISHVKETSQSFHLLEPGRPSKTTSRLSARNVLLAFPVA